MSIMPDPTFYPSPRMAMKAAPEQIAYVALLNVGENGKRDAVGVIDLESRSSTYGQLLDQVDFPNGDNELHHFGWNACSACLCPQAPHPTWSVVTWSFRASGHPGFTSWIQKPTPGIPKS